MEKYLTFIEMVIDTVTKTRLYSKAMNHNEEASIL
jgi:hypothetical protein